MTVNLTINGVTYAYPEPGDDDWGQAATSWAQGVTGGMLQKAGGAFSLTADANFGATYGLVSTYFKSRTSNIADAGAIRLARADVINWRNQANSGNLSLGVNSSDLLTFNGTAIQNTLSVTDTARIDLTLAADVLSADIVTGSITNTYINASAAIAYSKLNLTGSIVNADINASAAIAYSKLNLGGSIVNADISNSAAIAYSKLNLALSIVDADVSASAAIARSKLASGSNNYVVINNGSGVMSEEAQLAISRGGTSAATASAAMTALSPLTTKGDLLGFSTLNARVAVGTDGQVLTANSANATGLGWSSPLTNPMDSAGDMIVGGAAGAATKLDAGTANYLLTAAGAASPTWALLVNASVDAAAAIAYSKLNLTDSILNADINSAAAIAFSKMAALTASRALASSAGGVVAVSNTTTTQLEYLSAATGTTGTTSTNLVFSTSPTLVTPTLGVATATSINKLAITAPATSATLAIADGKTFTVSNTLTFTGTDTNSFTFPSGSSTVMTLASTDTITGAKTFGDGKLLLAGSSSGATTIKAAAAASTYVATLPAATTTLVGTDTTDTLTNKTLTSPKLNENVAVTTTATKLNYITSATGTTGTTSTNIVFSTSPTLVTPVLGAASSTSITNGAGSNTSPSYTFSGDTNTGFYSSAADTVSLAVGGTQVYNQNITTSSWAGSSTSWIMDLDANYRLYPGTNNVINLGIAGNRLKEIFCTNGTINTSDGNEKMDIKDSALGLEFIKKLKPKSYKFIDNTSGRTHYGLVAQDVERILEESDVKTTGFAGFIKTPKLEEDKKTQKSGEYHYGLRYNEFIAPMIKAIQEMSDKIDHLEKKIKLLEKNP